MMDQQGGVLQGTSGSVESHGRKEKKMLLLMRCLARRLKLSMRVAETMLHEVSGRYVVKCTTMLYVYYSPIN